MPLTPDEERELSQLEAEDKAAFTPSNLTPDEERELAQLEAEDQAHMASQQQTPSQDKVLPLEAAARGFAQSYTGGLADEATGAIQTAGDVLFGDTKLADAVDQYAKRRDESRANYRVAEVQQPGAYTTGQVAGGIAQAVTPGGTLLKGANLATKAGILGGIYGLGESEADLTKGEYGQALQDTATGALVGSAVGKGAEVLHNQATKYVGKIKDALSNLKPGKALVSKGVKVAANVLGDVPGEVSEKVLKDPTIIDNPKSLADIADDLVGSANKLKNTLSDLDTRAVSTLSKVDDIPSKDLIGLVRSELVNKGVLTSQSGKLVPSSFAQDKVALNKAKDVVRALSSSDTISEQKLKTLIQKMDKEIDWDSQAQSKANDLMQTLRKSFDNGVLKAKNPEYAARMKPVAEHTNLLEKLRKEFSLKSGGKGWEATDRTVSRLKSLSDDAMKLETMKPGSQNLVKTVDEVSGGSLGRSLETNKLNRLMNADLTRGSKNTVQGALVGTVSGGPLGAATGAIAGAAKDKYGRTAAINMLKKASPYLDETKLTQRLDNLPSAYQKILNRANMKGGDAVAVTHFILNNTDPRYRDAMQKED